MTEAAIIALGQEMKALGLHRHLEQLRAFWSAQRAGEAAEWPEAHVKHLARLLRVPPYQDALPVRPVTYHCPCTKGHHTHLDQRTVHVLGRYAEIQCTTCKETWLEPVAGDATT